MAQTPGLGLVDQGERCGAVSTPKPEDRRRLRPPEQRSRVRIVTKDTKAIIGTIIAAALTLGATLGGLLVNRIGNVETEIRAVRSELGSRIDRLHDEMQENYHRLDERMRAIEQGFARIDQRLDTLERAVIPSAEPAE